METEKFKLGFLERISLKYFSWKVGGSGKKVFEEVADLICHLFADEPNLDPRDLAAGLVLLYQSRDEVDPGANRTGHLLGDAPRPLLHRDPAEELVHWDSARRVSDTLEYASAAYKIEDKEQRSFTQKVKDGFKWISGFLKTNEQKVLKALPHLKSEDFLHLTELNDPLQTPFFVAADPRHKTVVISIRGTHTPQDVLTDVNASPASVKSILLEEGLEELVQAIEGIDGYFAHQGMVKSAVFVYKQIVEKGVAEKVKTKFGHHQLIVTGHSLGAGTAVLASFLLKRHFENLRCLAFSPPGGLLSESARAASEAFALSVTLGEDIVGRLSLDSFKELKNLALEKRATSSRSNAAILASNALTSGIATLGHWVKSWFVSSKDTYANVVPEVVPYSIDWTMKLLLPGRIWHLETSLPNDEDVRVVGVRLRNPSDFEHVVIGPNMLDDHSLDNVGKLMAMLASAKKTGNVEVEREVNE